MGILTKEVTITPRGRSIKYYKDLGYNAKYMQPLTIKVEDLAKTCKEKVLVRCDMCKKKEMLVSYNNYNSVIEKTGSYVCRDCSFIKQRETLQRVYGVSNISQIEEVKNKKIELSLQNFGTKNPSQSDIVKEHVKNTVRDRYSVDNISQCEEIKNKRKETFLQRFGVNTPTKNNDVKERIKQTSISRYGVSNPMQNENVKEKNRQSFISKYGVEYPSQIPEAKEKTVQSFIRNFGYDNPMKSPEIREKANKTLCENGTQKTSKQQLYLHNLFGGEINYQVKYYATDICFPDEHICIEYNGGGHNLRVTLGRLTQEEFDHKEIIRSSVIKREGYKIITIESKSDRLPQDTILLEMLSQARNYFSTTSHTWVTYNIDDQLVFNAEHKQGFPYDYGDLRTIK